VKVIYVARMRNNYNIVKYLQREIGKPTWNRLLRRRSQYIRNMIQQASDKAQDSYWDVLGMILGRDSDYSEYGVSAVFLNPSRQMLRQYLRPI
jgi:hypothetical protein